MTRIVEVIITDFCRGRGTPNDVCRTVYQMWTKDGKLLAESDSGPQAAQAESVNWVDPGVIRSL